MTRTASQGLHRLTFPINTLLTFTLESRSEAPSAWRSKMKWSDSVVTTCALKPNLNPPCVRTKSSASPQTSQRLQNRLIPIIQQCFIYKLRCTSQQQAVRNPFILNEWISRQAECIQITLQHLPLKTQSCLNWAYATLNCTACFFFLQEMKHLSSRAYVQKK